MGASENVGVSYAYRITPSACSTNLRHMRSRKSWCEHNTKYYKHGSARFDLFYDNLGGYYEKFCSVLIIYKGRT